MSVPTPDSLPDGPIISWYGDDFSGSAAVLEVLAATGLPSVLFMDIPTPEQLAPYASWRGIGIAGTARTRSPSWMEGRLPAVFEFLSSLSAPVAHYKLCSTFDSAPDVGSIGKAMELARPIFGDSWAPLLVAAPPIGRYQVFGNLFAVADGVVHRLDRHPTMSRHPVTPMDEADIRLHLAGQTSLPIGLVDTVSLDSGHGQEALQRELADGNKTVAFDVVDAEALTEIGRLIWENRGQQLLAFGSQGVEYALIRHWREMGLIDPDPPDAGFEPAERLAAVSASMSPLSAVQLEWAGDHGFELIRLDVAAAADPSRWPLEVDRIGGKALQSVAQGRDPIVYTAIGPDDPSAASFRAAVDSSDTSADEARERIGRGLGTILDRLVRHAGITRAAVAGGDTSSHVARALGVRSLTFLAAIEDGVSMLKADLGEGDGRSLELSSKGGQMGSIDYFRTVKEGREPT
ncbi:MAG: four-carbon acid sugar kinase family protein [Chloroflexota bacterium]